MSLDSLWEQLLLHDVNHELMVIETKAIKGQKINECGLKTAHAYVVLSALELSNEQRLVKVRNPWGWERYDCDYSDESKLWTPALREEAGATP